MGGVLTDSSSQGLFEEERPRRVQGRDPGHPQSQPGHRLTWGQGGALSLVQISPDTGLSLVELEPNNSGAKVCVITTHTKTMKIPPTRGSLCLSVSCCGIKIGSLARKESSLVGALI